jgi:hypothetical protein
MIVDVLRKLKFDTSYKFYRADGKFEADANRHVTQFHAESELQDIKAKCPKDD